MAYKTPLIFTLFMLVNANVYAAKQCTFKSGTETAALIELYTSEGCSSCPPAETYLNQLDENKTINGSYVPLALHVDYWDYIGWKDRFAQDTFVKRQNWLVALNKQRTLYTPHFFVNAVEFRSWRYSIASAVNKINSLPAQASIELTTKPVTDNKLNISVTATSQSNNPAALYLVVTEGGLSTKVKRGENSGATLHHDHVARHWHGPVKLINGQLKLEHQLEIPTNWDQSNLEVIAFVQDQHSGNVLQALRGDLCSEA